MPSTPIECGPGRPLLLAVSALHLGTALMLVVSSLAWPVVCVLLLAVGASLIWLWRQPQRWLWRDSAGWWLADSGDSDWQGPCELAAGSYLGSHLAILRLRRDRRHEHCIISVDRLEPDAWRRLRRDLGHP